MNLTSQKNTTVIQLPRPAGLYAFQNVSGQGADPDKILSMLASSLYPYVLEVMNIGRQEKKLAVHRATTSRPVDFLNCKGMVMASGVTLRDKQQESSLYLALSLPQKETDALTSNVVDGSLNLYETTTLVYTQEENTRYLYLILPYAEAKSALGGQLGEQIISLNAHPLMPFIKMQMLLLEQYGADLRLKGASTILDGLYNMSFVMLSEVGKALGYRYEGTKNFFFAAAKRYIEQHYADLELAPDAIALALRCSRSALDRACLEQQTSVMKVVQDVRLNAARHRLENYPEERIDTIAWLCGFSSPSLLSKLFKARFGMSPKRWRGTFMPGLQYKSSVVLLEACRVNG